MDYLTWAIFFINIIMLVIIFLNIKKMAGIRQDFVEIENNIARMVQENSRLVELILESEPIVKRSAAPATESQFGPAGLNIIDLSKAGMSIQEIAEKTGVPQGQIILTLNLYEKTLNKH